MTHPPLIFPARITMDYALANQQYIFIYGQDYFQKGCLGQSGHLGSQRPLIPNCFPIPTMLKFCSNPIYFPNDIDYCKAYIQEFLDKIPQKDGRPIIPLRKIGLGGSRCQEFAPKVYMYLRLKLAEIAYSNIVWQD